ncbi:dUTPase [Clostridium sp. SYSU_GA19001]|uniref:dUTPase n=1 Tax=Clostridium caldaquaticum TaxID=2940653 RepID=UPI0020773584|nr:dUTPase [Clostridium caldaquaticum]MCM8710521.1 dUTPase [Clostridium caldaquaticum]
MEIKELLKMQETLDNKIMDRFYKLGCNIGTKELINDKLLALFTEIGEFANELSTFKYWKHYHVENRKKALEEFADILFFYLSIANLLEYSADDIEKAYLEKWHKNLERQKNNY